MRQIKTKFNILFIGVLFSLMACTGAETALSSGVEDDAGTDVAEIDTIEGVQILALTHPDYDEGDGESEHPGCRSLDYEVEQTETRNFCFNPLGDEQHNVTVWDGETPLVRVIAGQPCQQVEIPTGTYELRVCHAGGDIDSLEDLVFVANDDITQVDEAAETVEEETGDDHDYEADELLSVSPRYFKAANVTTFLATNTCVRCNLSGYNFSGSNFTSAVLTSSNLTDANLSGVNFTNASLSRVFLDRANLTSANMTGATVSSASLKGANLTGANLTNANLTGSILRLVEMGSSNLTNATLIRTRFNEANLIEADFDGADVSRAYFENADLTDATFVGTDCSYAKFGDAILIGVDFDNADLTQSFFNFADMTDTILTDTVQFRTRFIGADMTNADFTGAVQTSIVLKNAVLDGATWVNGLTCDTPSTGECDL